MGPRKQIDDLLDEIIATDWVKENDMVTQIMREYEKLNEKCDLVISRIKERKQKKNKI